MTWIRSQAGYRLRATAILMLDGRLEAATLTEEMS
jgi:hypothetical protein